VVGIGRVARIERQANRLVTEVHLDRALERQLVARQQAAELTEACCRAGVGGDVTAVLAAMVLGRRRGRSSQLDRKHGRGERSDQSDRHALTRAERS
jgi:hypothetical protein